jgi:hypothetical protein
LALAYKTALSAVQAPDDASQASEAQSASATQPLHVLLVVSQMGLVPEQSLELRHSTHVFAVEHRGVDDGQSESCVQGGKGASTGGAVEHSWSIHTKPSSHGRVVSMTPSELQSEGETQQTTGLGREQAATFTTQPANTMNKNSPIRAACRSGRVGVNDFSGNVLG